MNTYTRIIRIIPIGFILVISAVSCKKDWLKPEPESFFTPENAFIDKAGFDGLLLSSRKQLRHEYYFSQTAICSEYSMSDVAVNGCPDATDYHNIETDITPNGQKNSRVWSGESNYWSLGWNGVKYGNIVISRIDYIKWSNEAERNAILAEGYFHKAYWYYRLINQFGDLPYLAKEITSPDEAISQESYTREYILKKCKKDLEFAVQWMPQVVFAGQVSRDAAYHLLCKINLELRDFDGAIAAASQVIDHSTSGRKIMTNRFGKYATNPSYNVLWDLHQRENKSTAVNTEGILIVQDKYAMEGNAETDNTNNTGCKTMRNYVPAWWWTPVFDPGGKRGTTDAAKNPLLDSLGRGIAAIRSSDWYNYEIWTDVTDIRHKKPNWWSKEQFYYNDPGSPYYRQPLQQQYFQNNDTIRTIYPFAYNKLFVAEDNRPGTSYIEGGHTDWYLFRIAETYLLRAEAYYWKGDVARAASDINVVRNRAQAPPAQPSEITIEYIFAERARELYAEEPRRTELARVSYIMAQAGISGYSLENMETKNWFYDMVMKHNNFYAKQISYGNAGAYIIKPYHVYWPVPQSAIDANTKGRINQNRGYVGAEKNVTPRNE